MSDRSWQSEGERVDRALKAISEGKCHAEKARPHRKQIKSAIERNREREARERAWEEMMTERIRTESALIRAENDARKRREGIESNTPPVAMRICRPVRRVGKAIDFER